jgi:hypothetical protein
MNIPGVTFIFEVQETGDWSQETECPSTFGGADFGLRTSDFSFSDTRHLIPEICFSSSFVFMNIPGVTFIF